MILAAVVIGLAANADNVGVGIAYGIQGRRIGPAQNLMIAAATTLVTGAAISVGGGLHRSLPAAVPGWAGGTLLILLAIAGLMRPAESRSQPGHGGTVGWSEAALLSASLSINNIGMAFAGGLAEVSRAAVLSSVFVFSIVLLYAGLAFGRRASGRINNALSQAWIGNVALLAAGAMVLFGL